MGLYADQFIPRFQDKTLNVARLAPLRARACEGLHGEVVEIGFGTGLNVAHYPTDVTRVVAIEPSSLCMRIAAPRIAASGTRIEFGGLTGERLDLASEQFDAVLSTFTLCTIPDLGAALAEVRRVLKPGGAFHFVEHGHAPDEHVARWQRRIEPLHKRIFCGCHLTRRIDNEVADAGFAFDRLTAAYMPRSPKTLGYMYEGRACKR